MDVTILKWMHIVSATLLVGTGFGSAYYKYLADRSGDLKVMALTNRHVVLADWIFTTPTIIIQPLTGFALAHYYGYPLTSLWLVITFTLFALVGLCWLPVVYMQIIMKRDSQAALINQSPLPGRYWRMARAWFWLGIPAFTAMLIVFYLMIARPTLA